MQKLKVIKMWRRLDVIFALKSPLHIGYLPFKGSVISPTRYYVLGKNFWGAVTKRATENLYESPTTKEYKVIGSDIKENFIFSYFYLYDGEIIFTPKYSEVGLIFGDKKQIDKLQFERRFVGSRILTAIESDLGTAKDETLHEIEFINDKYSDEKGNIKTTKIIGCIWVKEGAKLNGSKIEVKNCGIFVDNFNLIEELTLGGEIGCGFGLTKLESILNEKRFSINDDSTGEKVEITNNNPILSHFEYRENIPFNGEIEILTGRGYFDIERNDLEIAPEYKKNAGKILSNIAYYFSPGTTLKLGNNIKILLDWKGIMRIVEN
ncbi:MAG: hypothetical protein ACUVQP_11890 [Bacteroidales bacterium]